MEDLERANNLLINMENKAMTDKEQIKTLTRTLIEFTKRFRDMEAKLDRVVEGQTGEWASAGTPTPNKDVMGPTCWNVEGKKIWYQGGYCWIHSYCKASSQQHHVPLVGKTSGSQGECQTQEQHGGIGVGKDKKMMETGDIFKKDSE